MGVPELLTSLRELYPPERLLTTPAQLTPFESDALTAFRARPEAVVLAETQQEVIDTVRLCHREGVPFVARGTRRVRAQDRLRPRLDRRQDLTAQRDALQALGAHSERPYGDHGLTGASRP